MVDVRGVRFWCRFPNKEKNEEGEGSSKEKKNDEGTVDEGLSLSLILICK